MRKPVFAAPKGATKRLTSFQRVMLRTGRQPSECHCRRCQQQCITPCLGTPDDILRLMDAGYMDRLCITDWAAGVLMGVTRHLLTFIQADMLTDEKEKRTRCTFFHDGRCELHEKGLKPTEGKLSHHSIRIDNFRAGRSLSWAVAQEWLEPENREKVLEVFRRYEEYQKRKYKDI